MLIIKFRARLRKYGSTGIIKENNLFSMNENRLRHSFWFISLMFSGLPFRMFVREPPKKSLSVKNLIVVTGGDVEKVERTGRWTYYNIFEKRAI